MKIRPPRSEGECVARVVMACANRVHRAVFAWGAGVGCEERPQRARKGSALGACGYLVVVLSGDAVRAMVG